MKVIGSINLESKRVLALVLTPGLILIFEALKKNETMFLQPKKICIYSICYVLWILIFEEPIHELLHKYGGKIRNIECEINLKYKWRNHLWRIDVKHTKPGKFPYCRAKEGTYLNFQQLAILAAFPLIIPIVWIVIYVISHNSIFLITSAMSFAGSMGDIAYILFAYMCTIRNPLKQINFKDDGDRLEAFDMDEISYTIKG